MLSHDFHRASLFFCGLVLLVASSKTKGLDTRDQLLEFHGKHYHAANMALVVLGKEDLDHLEGWARDLFKEVGDCSAAFVRWLQERQLSTLPRGTLVFSAYCTMHTTHTPTKVRCVVENVTTQQIFMFSLTAGYT